MKRIHVIGLPRSGTTALSASIANALGLPLATEPVFLWTDGFKYSLEEVSSLSESRLQGIKERLTELRKCYRNHAGFVEKTPSSVFFAPVLDKLVTDSIIIVITRSEDDIIRSLVRKVLNGEDGNVARSSSLLLHNATVRTKKLWLLFRSMGVVRGIVALVRFISWSKRNGINALGSPMAVKDFVEKAGSSLAELEAGETNKILVVSYSMFREEPEKLLNDIVCFCRENDLRGGVAP